MPKSTDVSLNLAGVNPRENKLKLTSLRTGGDYAYNGLVLTSGAIYGEGNMRNVGLVDTPFNSAASAAVIKKFEGVSAANPGGVAPTTLTSAVFRSVHLVAGEVLTVRYDFQFGDDGSNDYAFMLLQRTVDSGPAGILLASGNDVIANKGQTFFTTTTNITLTGDYNILLGVSDAVDTRQRSTLVVHSLSYTAPDTGLGAATVLPNAIRRADGTLDLANGTSVLPSGTATTAALAGTGQFAVAKVVSNDGGSLIGQDGGSLISQDGGGLISQDGGGLISQDGGSLISQDGGSVTVRTAAYTGASLPDQAKIGTARVTSTRPDLTLSRPAIGADMLVGEPAAKFSHQNNPKVDALPTGRYVVVWSDDLSTGTGGTGAVFEIRGQLFNADGSKAGASFVVSTGTASDQIDAGVTGLVGGGFVVTWRGQMSTGADIHAQVYDANGVKSGGESRIGQSLLRETGPQVSSAWDGGFYVTYLTTLDGTANLASVQRFSPTAARIGGEIVVGSDGGTGKRDVTSAGLHDGGVAIAYREVNPAATGDTDGIFLDIVSPAGVRTRVAVPVNSSTVGTQDFPGITTLANGNIVVAWLDGGVTSGADVSTLRAQIFDTSGARIGNEIRLADVLAQSAAPALTALNDGRWLVAWNAPNVQAGVVSGVNVYAQVVSADGLTASAPFSVNTPSATDAYREQNPAVTQLANNSIVVVGSQTDGSTSSIHQNILSFSADGMLVKAGDDLQTGHSPTGVVTADLNGDGFVDFVTSDNTGTATTFLGAGDGTFTKAFTLAPVKNISGNTIANPFSIVAADLNGDGKVDVVIGSQSFGLVETLFGQGDGSFVEGPLIRFGAGGAKLHLVDLNNDGTLDLVSTTNGYVGFGVLGNVAIAYGDGSGNFVPGAGIQLSHTVNDVFAADLNKDGRTDLVTMEGTQFTVQLGSATGYVALPSVVLGSDLRAAVFGDLNGDGIPDLVVGDYASGTTAFVLVGKGDGTFQTPVKVGVGDFPNALALGDVNGDGNLDLVASNYNDNTVTVSAGDGKGGFGPATRLAAGLSPDAVALADFNEDGRLDAVATAYGRDSGPVSIYLSQPLTPSAPVTRVGTNPAAGTVDDQFTDAFGHLVTDTKDSAGRLLKEVVADAVTKVALSTTSFTYAADGTRTQHTDAKTPTGSLVFDVAAGATGTVTETTKSASGIVTSTATVTYKDDAMVLRHQVNADGGSDDVATKAGLQVLNIHADAAGGVTFRDASGATTGTQIKVEGGTAANSFVDGPANQLFVGGTAKDSVSINEVRRGATVTDAVTGDVFVLHGGQVDTVRGVEEIKFIDGRVVLDPNDPAASVLRLYQAALGRAPDQGGLNFWIGNLQTGGALADLATGFLTTPEFISRFGNGLNNNDFVLRIYGNVLGRDPEQDGLSFWKGRLDEGAGRGNVLAGISESGENKAKTAGAVKSGIWDVRESAAQVARLYDTALGRLPDAGGLAFWADAIDGKTGTLLDLAAAFVSSGEFVKTYGTLNSRQFVEAVYGNTLGRPGDKDGVDFWTGRLDSGASRATVVIGFSETMEHQAKTAANIMSEDPSSFGIKLA